MASIKAKLVIKDLGNPKKGAALTKEGDKVLLGTIIGIATDKMVRQNQNDPTQPFIGLKGNFEGTPADEKEDGGPIGSGVLYLPEGVQNTILDPLMAVDADGKRITHSIQFAFEVYSVRASNAAGYSFEFLPAIEQGAADPLAGARAALASIKKPPAIEDKTGSKGAKNS